MDNVGIKTGLSLHGRLDDVNVARKFSEHFLVTFSKDKEFKSSKYVFNFLKPAKDFKNSFNLYNEVLLLLSPYHKYYPRVLDFVDKTLYEYENRLDKICIIIVSNDSKIESEIQKANNENKASRIIIPFTYDEVLSSDFDDSYLGNKFRKYFYNRDLFALDSPLTSEAYFYGRNNVVHSFYDNYNSGQHAGLFGLRKTGKTSVLFALERMIELRGGNSIYIDCQDPAINQLRWYELLHEIIRLILEKYEISGFIEYPSYEEKNASRRFKEELTKIKEILYNNKILLIFDEIEYISYQVSSAEHWNNGHDFLNFWNCLRASCHTNKELFSFLIAGVNPFCIECEFVEEFDNPLFSLLEPTYLELFSATEVEEMVSDIGKYMGLSFDKEIYTDLTDNYGGHPFLIRHVCSLLNKSITINRPIRVNKLFYRERKQEFDASIQNYVTLIIMVLKKRYPEEYNLLEILAVKGSDEFKKELKYVDNKIISHLLGYGIVEINDGNYYIKIDSLKDFISNNSKLNKNLTSKEEKWIEVCSRRNTIEEKLRKLILTSFTLYYGKNAKDEILKAINKERRASLSENELSDIFSNHLYFLDLKQIIEKNWEIFQKMFNDKAKFTSYSEYVNKCRIDAHAKDIHDEDLAILLIAIQWLENNLLNID